MENLTVKTKKVCEVIDSIELSAELSDFLNSLYVLKTRKIDYNTFSVNLLKKLVNDYLSVDIELSADKRSAGYTLDSLSLKGFNLDNFNLFCNSFLKTIALTTDDKFNFFCKGMQYQISADKKDIFIKFTNMKCFIANINEWLTKNNLTAKNPLSLLTGAVKISGEIINLKTLKIIPKKTKK